MNRKSAHMPISGDPYYNCLMVAPDGQPLGYCDKKRFNWYMSRGLADALPDGSGIKLKFEPSGRHGARNIMPRRNRCVVCGHADELTKHHVVPYCYRAWLPEYMKSHNSYDVHALCIPCHVKYEPLAWKLKVSLAKEHGAHPTGGVSVDPRMFRIRSAARALVMHSNKMPEDKRASLVGKIKEHLGRDPSTSDLEFLAGLDCRINPIPKLHGQLIVEAVVTAGSEQEFVVMWRRHFVESMLPKHMPDGWEIDKLVTSRDKTSPV